MTNSEMHNIAGAPENAKGLLYTVVAYAVICALIYGSVWVGTALKGIL